MSCIAFKKDRGTKVNQYLNRLELRPVRSTEKGHLFKILSGFVFIFKNIFQVFPGGLVVKGSSVVTAEAQV